MVEDALSEEILLGHVRLGDHVEAYAADGKLCFRTVGHALPEASPEPEKLPQA